MLNALTVRERRLLLGILAVLLLGAMVKLWRWRAVEADGAGQSGDTAVEVDGE